MSSPFPSKEKYNGCNTWQSMAESNDFFHAGASHGVLYTDDEPAQKEYDYY